jgi:hypothetical protein
MGWLRSRPWLTSPTHPGNRDHRECRREPDETISHRGSHGVSLVIPVNMGRASPAGLSQPSHRLARWHHGVVAPGGNGAQR